MGFFIVICVFIGIMFISYCIVLAEFNEIIRCRKIGWDWERGYYGNRYCYFSSDRYLVVVGFGLSFCMLIFIIVEFILVFLFFIYCCNVVCCNVLIGVVNIVSVVYIFVYIYKINKSLRFVYKIYVSY